MRSNGSFVHPETTPSMVYADENGLIKDFPELKMAGRSGRWFSKPAKEDLIPLPEGSELFVLPDRIPVGIDPKNEESVLLGRCPDRPRREVRAVAAFMAPAHTAIHTAAYQEKKKNIAPLPLFAYTAVGWHRGKFWVSAFRSDSDCRQDADQFNSRKIKNKTRKLLQTNQGNRLIQHLGNCCLTYGCPAARNYFLGRWEAPLPTSPVCNANCLGCISSQPSGCCPTTQDRIRFIPTAAEIVDVAVPHLLKAPRPIVSFGQGCEGEPLLQAEILEQAITHIRTHTKRGTINLNSNASLPEKVERLAHAGLDSLRVSLNSARPEFHSRYYRSKSFSLDDDVTASISVMKQNNRFVSLNYFILPGFTDDPPEFEALCRLIHDYQPDLIQLRNLNLDPDWYFKTLQYAPQHPPLGIRQWRKQLATVFPRLRFGYFNPALTP